MRTWIGAAAIALAATFVVASGLDPGIPTASAQPQGPAAGARERARQKIRALRAMILVQELGLDEATVARLGPVLAKHDDELARLGAERGDLRKALRAALDAGDDRKLDGIVDKLVANQRARWDAEQARFTEVRRLLTPRQAARMVEVLPQIDRRILQGLRRAVRDAAALDDGDDAGDDVAPPPPPRRRLRRGR